MRRHKMRLSLAVLALAGTESALAHTPDASWLSGLGHQLTSLHHLPAIAILAVLAVLLFAVRRRIRATH
jgi:hydrogenase/urease accessory protein HupE